jgi:hypothetical protein
MQTCPFVLSNCSGLGKRLWKGHSRRNDGKGAFDEKLLPWQVSFDLEPKKLWSSYLDDLIELLGFPSLLFLPVAHAL